MINKKTYYPNFFTPLKDKLSGEATLGQQKLRIDNTVDLLYRANVLSRVVINLG